RASSWPISDELAHRRPLAAAHGQALGDAVEHHLPMGLLVAAAGALETADPGACHEAVAMDAHEGLRGFRAAELALERDERLLDQVLALARAHGHVLLLGALEM